MVSTIFTKFPYIGNKVNNWRTHIFRWVGQPPTRYIISIIHTYQNPLKAQQKQCLHLDPESLEHHLVKGSSWVKPFVVIHGWSCSHFSSANYSDDKMVYGWTKIDGWTSGDSWWLDGLWGFMSMFLETTAERESIYWDSGHPIVHGEPSLAIEVWDLASFYRNPKNW